MSEKNEKLDKQKEIRKVTVKGMVANVFLSALKMVIGYFSNSQALIADGIHSFSDLSTDISIMFGVKFWLAPADQQHPYGHHKIELLVTIFISLVLIVVGFGILLNSVVWLNNVDTKTPHLAAFIVAVVSIILKEWLYRYTVKKAKQLKSSAVKANAWHHRSDALSSVPVAAVIILASVYPDLIFLDCVGAIVVSIFIIYPACKMFYNSICCMIDEGIDKESLKQIEEVALTTENVSEVHDVRSRKIGQTIFLDMHVLVDGNIPVKEGHFISEQVKKNLMEYNSDILDVMVHIEPFNSQESKKNS
jgi:cation diffusion facilitator family transporter